MPPSSPNQTAARPLGESRPLRAIGRGLLILLLLGTVTFAAFGFLGDFGRIRELLRGFSPVTLALVLLLSLVNYWLRFLRWQFYLRGLSVRLSWRRSLSIFLAGLVLATTPGKSGELAKAWLSRELGGSPARPVVAVVVTERLLDVFAVLLLLLASGAVFGGQLGIVAPVVLMVAAVAVTAVCGPLLGRLLPRLARTRLLRRRAAVLLDIRGAFGRLMKPGMLLPALGLSLAAWAAEGVGCALVVRHYAPSASVLGATFDYLASCIAGAVSMLPGGLVAADGSLVLLLERRGIPLDAALASTVIVRTATLWFAVVVGLAALPWVLALLRRARQVDDQHDGDAVQPDVDQERDVGQQ